MFLFCILQNLKCHSKSAHDFVFIASSSLIATAGHSTESRNICLWDTLQPQRTALIQGIITALTYKSNLFVYDTQHAALFMSSAAHNALPLVTLIHACIQNVMYHMQCYTIRFHVPCILIQSKSVYLVLIYRIIISTPCI